MKKKFSFIFSLIIVFGIISSMVATISNASTTTHEAESHTNKFKYAIVSGSYVEFEAHKDAYIEMKKVNAPSSGTVSLTFVYSNSSGGSAPIEVKVNSRRILNKVPFENTGGSWAEKTITASMNNSNNKIRFKVRAPISGIRLDKVILNDNNNDDNDDDGSDSSPSPPSDDSANYEITSDGTFHVLSGTFDCGGESYGNVGDGSQDEDQPAVFELEPGTNLIDCIIVPPAGDGIHVHGNNTVENVRFLDVGEDAISMRSNFEGGTVTIRNCSFSNADDKVLQVNRESTWYLYGLTVNTAGKVMRQNGGKTFKLDVYIDGLVAYDINEALVRSDSPNCTVFYRNITTDLRSDKWWKGELNTVPW